MKEKMTHISELGEFGLIDRITSNLTTHHKETMLGAGDDAAVIKGTEANILMSTDMLIEGTHFDLSFMPLQHLGYKSVVVNVSDIAAMNAIPKQIVVSLGVSSRFTVEAIEEIYKGFKLACDEYRIDLVGGDTTSSSSGLIINITILGEGQPEKVALRKNAKDNDIVCVTGDLGGAYLGLQVLEREKQVFIANPDMQPELDKYEYIVGRQLRPKARMDIIHELDELNLVPTAMIDVSDGLASELLHLSKQSGIGICVFEDKIPIEKQSYEVAAELNLDATTCALNGGEDYELLFTISSDEFEKIKTHQDISMIGYVSKKEEGVQMVTRGKQKIEVTAQGWNHFKD